MAPNLVGILVGGVLPAILLGVFATLQKAALQAGSSPGVLLLAVGVGAIAVGLVYLLVFRSPPSRVPSVSAVADLSGDATGAQGADGLGAWRLRPIALSLATGIVWAVGTALVSVAITVYGTPLSQLVPVFNTNTLVAVVLGLLVFGEWATVNTPRLLIGAVLIVVGGVLAGTS
jgi:hypothetical protein